MDRLTGLFEQFDEFRQSVNRSPESSSIIINGLERLQHALAWDNTV